MPGLAEFGIQFREAVLVDDEILDMSFL